nr:YhgE/Pip family protein [Sulfobacillus harzensis]
MIRWSQGATHAESGIRHITQGLDALEEGTANLAASLPTFEPAVQDSAHPVSAYVATGSENYGTGMAPYFLGLSLWVGAVVATVLVPGGRYDKRRLGSRSWQSLAVAGLQIAFLGIGTTLVLPMHPMHALAYGLSLIGIGAVWWACLRLLVEKFGDAGRVLGIVLLVVQLAGAGGTYPVVLSPGFFQAIHPYLPMTWAVHVLRWALSNGYPNRVLGDAERLLALGIGAIVLTRWWPAQWLFEAPVLTDQESTAVEDGRPNEIA